MICNLCLSIHFSSGLTFSLSFLLAWTKRNETKKRSRLSAKSSSSLAKANGGRGVSSIPQSLTVFLGFRCGLHFLFLKADGLPTRQRSSYLLVRVTNPHQLTKLLKDPSAGTDLQSVPFYSFLNLLSVFPFISFGLTQKKRNKEKVKAVRQIKLCWHRFAICARG